MQYRPGHDRIPFNFWLFGYIANRTKNKTRIALSSIAETIAERRKHWYNTSLLHRYQEEQRQNMKPTLKHR